MENTAAEGGLINYTADNSYKSEVSQNFLWQ